MAIGNSIADLTKLYELSILDGVSNGTLATNAIQIAFTIFAALNEEERRSPEQVILEYLKQISEQISNVRAEMHERFDAVDEKLDTILLTVVNGLDKVVKKQKISARQIIKNTRITLGTQYLVLNESNRISNLLTDLSIGICEERLNSTLGQIPENILDGCLFSVKKFVTESIYGEELPLNMTELSVSLNKDSQTRSTNLLQEYRANLNNTEVGEALVSPELWYFWSNVYRRLLLHDVDYTITTLADNGLTEVKRAGENIREFQRTILEDLSKVDAVESNPHPLAELLSATEEAISVITDATMQGPVEFYTNNRNIRCIEMEFNRLKSCNRDTPVIQEGFPSTLTEEGVAAVAAAVPGVSDLLNSGLGKLKYKNTLVSSKNGKGGRGLFGGRKKYRLSDTFKLTISLEPTEANIPPKIIGTVDYTVTGKRIKTANRGAFLSAGSNKVPRFCSRGRDESCIIAGIMGAINSTKTLSSVVPFGSIDRVPYIEYWNSLREEAGQHIIGNIEANSKSAAIDDNLDNSNTYLAAILRFVFSENIEDNDVIYAFANDKIRMPLLGNILNVTKNNPSLIWKLDSVYASKKDEYIKYFKSLKFQTAVYDASLQDLLSDAIDSVSRTSEILISHRK